MDRIQHIAKHLCPTTRNVVQCNPTSNSKQAGAGKKVTLIGSGIIGRNWAVLFSRAGYDVCMYDIKEQQLENALKELKEVRIPLLSKYDMLFGCDAEAVFNRITTTTDLQTAVQNCVLIQEGVPESLALKQSVFRTLGDALYSLYGEQCSTILSSSSSTMIPTKIIAKMRHLQGNVLVSHPVNPPMAIPVVELCPSQCLKANVMEQTKAIMQSIGLKPCAMKKEAEGFIVNRLQYGLLQAAYQCVADGIADAEDVDNTVKHGLGLRWSFMGPFETIHLNAPKGVKDYCERYAKQCIEPVLSQVFKPDKDGNDAFQHWTPQVWNKIHEEMEQKVCKQSEIAQRCQWRNDRLLNLAVHKKQQEQKDKV